MTGLTNNEIVEFVYKQYKIKSLIKHMIDYAAKDKSCDDLEQYIYIQLLLMNNERLVTIFHSNKLRNFISQIIKNARNGGVAGNNTEYTKYLHVKNTNETYWNDLNIADISEYDETLDEIIEYIDIRSNMLEGVKYSSEQLKYILAYSMLKKYFLSDLTQTTLAKHLNLSRSTVGALLKLAKQDILKKFTL